MVFDADDAERFNQANVCYVCTGAFSDEKGQNKVRDHCHHTGKFRGTAHAACNLKLKKAKKIDVFFHNLAGYDSHLFIRNLGTTAGDVNCIPVNDEQFISFSKNVVVGEYRKGEKTMQKGIELRFLDSAKFMGRSLASHVENLKNSGSSFPNLSKAFSGAEQRKLLTRKGVFPYDWFTDLRKLDQTSLPPRSAFYLKLSGKNISTADYLHGKLVWKKFGCKTMRDYHDLYMTSDVLLLADVFEAFRDRCLKHYELDPYHYYTALGLSWDAALKITNQKLELISDPEMLEFVERAKRGGISTITKRQSKANNRYQGKEYLKGLTPKEIEQTMGEFDVDKVAAWTAEHHPEKHFDAADAQRLKQGVLDGRVFNPAERSRFIVYLDANNLYGWAMSKRLPTGGFKWLDAEKIDPSKPPPSFVEVDLEYPDHLHDHFNDYVPSPEKIIPPGGKTSKLTPNLMPKERYVCHYRNLKQLVKLGVKVTKVHRALGFKESNWLKPYIELNTKLRAATKNDFEKDFFKLMNNAVFGKT